MKTKIVSFLFGAGIWYTIEYLFKVVLTNNFPPYIGTAFIAGLALILVQESIKLQKNLLISSLKITLTITIFEYIVGMSYYKFYNKRLWNYTQLFMNLHGFVCLKYSIIWFIIVSYLMAIFQRIRKNKLTL